MGREMNGVRMENNKSPYAKVKTKVSSHSNKEETPKSPEVNSEIKECEVKECTSEGPTKVTVDTQTWKSPRALETPISPTPSNLKSPNSNRKSQPTTPPVARKPSDDDDNWSMASSTRTTRSRATVAVAPTFTSTERMERRKEYYAKLEEKRKALAAEKREYEARTKEDEEAAIKQLRKNMVVKANPVPSFYYEKPPPKKELKKLPTTRAVSPKLGRRKSCNDAVCTSSSNDKISGRALRRNSLGSLREGPTQMSKPNKKDPLIKDRSKQVKETMKNNTSPKVTKRINSDVAVKS